MPPSSSIDSLFKSNKDQDYIDVRLRDLYATLHNFVNAYETEDDDRSRLVDHWMTDLKRVLENSEPLIAKHFASRKQL